MLTAAWIGDRRPWRHGKICRKNSHIRRGGSTITMQLQRLRSAANYLEQSRSGTPRTQLERTQTKRQILVEYANRAPFGGNLVGAGAASWRYFGRPCSQLSLGEAALLAGLPQSPNRLRPDRHPAASLVRRNHVLERMLAMGLIDAKQFHETCAPITAVWRPLPQKREMPLPAADGAMPTLSWLSKHHAGTTLRSTIDAAIQMQVAAMPREHLAHLEGSRVTASAVIVLDTQTAGVLAPSALRRAIRTSI